MFFARRIDSCDKKCRIGAAFRLFIVEINRFRYSHSNKPRFRKNARKYLLLLVELADMAGKVGFFVKLRLSFQIFGEVFCKIRRERVAFRAEAVE